MQSTYFNPNARSIAERESVSWKKRLLQASEIEMIVFPLVS